MSFSFDLYVQRRSWLHAVDPRVKLAFVFLGTILMLTFKNLFIMLLSLVITHLLIFSAGVPGYKVKWVWKTMLPINILIPALWVVFYPEGPTVLFQFWFLKVTALSVVRGVSLALRLDAIAFICFTWLFTTGQASLVRSLVKLGLPFEWGLVLAIGLRYIPTFYGLYTVVSEAQQARALDLTRGNLDQREAGQGHGVARSGLAGGKAHLPARHPLSARGLCLHSPSHRHILRSPHPPLPVWPRNPSAISLLSLADKRSRSPVLFASSNPKPA
jgi:energy-coupling factor transport system permease protein